MCLYFSDCELLVLHVHVSLVPVQDYHCDMDLYKNALVIAKKSESTESFPLQVSTTTLNNTVAFTQSISYSQPSMAAPVAGGTRQ